MIDVLKRYLDKIGVKDFTALSGEERTTYDNWVDILSKTLTIESIKEFIELQIPELRTKLKEHVENGEDRKALYITAKLNNWEALLDLIEEPDRSKEVIKEHIKHLLEEDN